MSFVLDRQPEQSGPLSVRRDMWGEVHIGHVLRDTAGEIIEPLAIDIQAAHGITWVIAHNKGSEPIAVGIRYEGAEGSFLSDMGNIKSHSKREVDIPHTQGEPFVITDIQINGTFYPCRAVCDHDGVKEIDGIKPLPVLQVACEILRRAAGFVRQALVHKRPQSVAQPE